MAPSASRHLFQNFSSHRNAHEASIFIPEDVSEERHQVSREEFTQNLAEIEAASKGLPSVEEFESQALMIKNTSGSKTGAKSSRLGSNRLTPSAGHAFPKDDSVVSRVKPPSPCKVCGSALHWVRECKYWVAWSQGRAANLICAEYDLDEDINAIYHTFYVASVQKQSNESCSLYSATEWRRVLGEQFKSSVSLEKRAMKATCEEVEDSEPAQMNPAARNTSIVQYCPGTRATYLNYRQDYSKNQLTNYNTRGRPRYAMFSSPT